MEKLTFIIPGNPIAKKRPRFFRRGNHVGAYNAQETEEGRFMWEIKNSLPDGFEAFPQGTPISLQCVFAFSVPASSTKKKRELMLTNTMKHTKKPDTDNCVKFVKDCLNSLIWHDDSQVYKVEAWKKYADRPHTLIVIEVV